MHNLYYSTPICGILNMLQYIVKKPTPPPPPHLPVENGGYGSACHMILLATHFIEFEMSSSSKNTVSATSRGIVLQIENCLHKNLNIF